MGLDARPLAGAPGLGQAAGVRCLLAGALVGLLAACHPSPTVRESSTPDSPGAESVTSPSALELSRTLEDAIAQGHERPGDRERAYEAAALRPDDQTADYAFARAALAGRLAENRGLGAGKLVTEAEHWARLALERDPTYDGGAATRMLGTLYVMAPGRLVEHGDAEEGLSMLERLATEHPEEPRNHLRLAEALVFMGDTAGAAAPLCRAMTERAALRADEQKLLASLVEDVGGEAELRCAPQT